MPKLLITSGIFHPEAGGPATYLHEIAPALQARAWQIEVLTYGDAPTTGYPYPVTRIPRRALPLRLAHYARVAWRPARRADVIYAHTIDLPVAWGATSRVIKIVGDQAWERCIRRGWVPPTTDIDTFQHASYTPLVDWQRASRARQVRAFDRVIVPSGYLQQMVTGWGVPAERVHVIYNALPALPSDLPASQADARRSLGWDDRPTLFIAARLTAWKGIDHVIAAIRHLPQVRLVVAGDGDQRAYLQRLARDLGERVVLLGRVARDRVYTMMQAADYVVLYSGYEGLPHTLLEALRVGTPVIASDKGGNPEVVQDGVNGLLVPYVDVPALRARIAHALTIRAQLARQTHIGMERFTFERMVSATHQVLMQAHQHP